MKNKVVNELMKEVLGTVKSIKQFSVDQLPDLGKQLLQEVLIETKYALVKSTFFTLFGLFTGVGSIVGSRNLQTVIFAITADDLTTHDLTFVRVLLIFLGFSFGIVFISEGVSGFINQLRDLELLRKAPKAALLKIISSKLK